MNERRAPRARGAAAVAFAVVVLGLLAYLVLASPIFQVSTIQVLGNRRLSDASIRRMTGATVGDSLVLAPIDDIESSVESSPWIRDARVTRALPDTLVVNVRERAPFAHGEDPSGTFLVADDGVVLERTDDTASFPSLGRFDRELAPGDAVPGIAEQLRALASIDPSVRRRIDSVSFEAEGLTLNVSGGGQIRYGDPTDLARKGAAAQAVLDWAGERRVEFAYIDVSSPESPVLRPRGRAEVEPSIDADPRG